MAVHIPESGPFVAGDLLYRYPRHGAYRFADIFGRDQTGTETYFALPVSPDFLYLVCKRNLPDTGLGRGFVIHPLGRRPLLLPRSLKRFLELRNGLGFVTGEKTRLGARLIEHVNGLVGEIPVRHIPVGQLHTCGEGLVRIPDVMVLLVPFPEPVENPQGILPGSRFHHYLLETPLKRPVVLDALPVFVERGSPDTLQFASGERRFEDVCRIESALRGTCSHDGMYLVNEENDIPLSFQALHELLDTLLELSPVFGACHQRRHIERKDTLAVK